jgi:RimJ/RimL family protein N-acetyltransferase
MATRILGAVQTYCRETGAGPLYSHVDKENLPSLRVHEKCGFSVIAEESVFLDGTIRKDHVTFYWA